MDVTSIQIKKDIHRRLKMISAMSDKKLYELIAEAVIYLESKYSHLTNNVENQDE